MYTYTDSGVWYGSGRSNYNYCRSYPNYHGLTSKLCPEAGYCGTLSARAEVTAPTKPRMEWFDCAGTLGDIVDTWSVGGRHFLP